MKTKTFLYQKYVLEGLSIPQIMALTMSSKTTVKRYLHKAHIQLRLEDLTLGPPSYGERRLNGRKVQNKAELEIAERIKDLSEQGLSATQIAKLFCTLNLPSKKGGKWYAKTILTILKKMNAKKCGA